MPFIIRFAVGKCHLSLDKWPTAPRLRLVGEALTVFGRKPATESMDYEIVKRVCGSKGFVRREKDFAKGPGAVSRPMVIWKHSLRLGWPVTVTAGWKCLTPTNCMTV